MPCTLEKALLILKMHGAGNITKRAALEHLAELESEPVELAACRASLTEIRNIIVESEKEKANFE
jgi:hypothetical protein